MSLWIRLRQLSDAVNHATVVVCAVLLLVMLTISGLGIALSGLSSLATQAGVGHWFDEGPLAFLHDNTRSSMLRLFLPWFGMLSITVAFKYGEHIAIIALARSLPRWAARAAQGLNLAAIAIFGVALVWYGFEFAATAQHLYILSDTVQVSHRWTAAAVPVAGAILCLHLADGVGLLQQSSDETGDEGPREDAARPAASGKAGAAEDRAVGTREAAFSSDRSDKPDPHGPDPHEQEAPAKVRAETLEVGR
ncbi:TRAP transporter small permease [Stappia sp.]|uniref:TRAP transporter small permease n=1 Tax=Stappia sp. TaxID=1870903 RepID=UPI0032D91668